MQTMTVRKGRVTMQTVTVREGRVTALFLGLGIIAKACAEGLGRSLVAKERTQTLAACQLAQLLEICRQRRVRVSQSFRLLVPLLLQNCILILQANCILAPLLHANRSIRLLHHRALIWMQIVGFAMRQAPAGAVHLESVPSDTAAGVLNVDARRAPCAQQSRSTFLVSFAGVNLADKHLPSQVLEHRIRRTKQSAAVVAATRSWSGQSVTRAANFCVRTARQPPRKNSAHLKSTEVLPTGACPAIA